MKIRKGFVSNSSSSSFIVKLKKESREYLEHHLNRKEFEKIHMDKVYESDPDYTFENAVDAIFEQIEFPHDNCEQIVNHLLNPETIHGYDFSELLSIQDIVLAANAYFPVELFKVTDFSSTLQYLSKQSKDKLIEFIKIVLKTKYKLEEDDKVYAITFGNEYDLHTAWLEYNTFIESLFGDSLIEKHYNH